MIFRRLLDVYQCSDSLCLSDCFFVLGLVVGDIAVWLSPSWNDLGLVLYVVRKKIFHALIHVLISHFETIAFVC